MASEFSVGLKIVLSGIVLFFVGMFIGYTQNVFVELKPEWANDTVGDFGRTLQFCGLLYIIPVGFGLKLLETLINRALRPKSQAKADQADD